MIKKLAILSAIALTAGLASCNEADIASQNVSKAADNFQVLRRLTFFAVVPMKGVEPILKVEGLCSLGNADSAGELTITCKDGSTSYKKHFIGLRGDYVSYDVEQIESVTVDPYHYKVVWSPSAIIPDIDIR